MKCSRGFTLIELLIVVTIIGIIAGIAIPSLLRARVAANESAAIGDIRAVITAQVGFQAAATGFYGEMTCLSEPSGCIPGYSPTAATFIDREMASLVPKNGYQRSFTPGGTNVSPGLWSQFCYQASPVTPDSTGVRSFGGDFSGTVGASAGSSNCCSAGALDTTTCRGLR